MTDNLEIDFYKEGEKVGEHIMNLLRDNPFPKKQFTLFMNKEQELAYEKGMWDRLFK